MEYLGILAAGTEAPEPRPSSCVAWGKPEGLLGLAARTHGESEESPKGEVTRKFSSLQGTWNQL